jgi:4-amino-4-deoxy-L-arabinose transferase-like glycosyltransferase
MAIAKRGSVCRTSRKSTDSSESISTEQEPVPVELNDLLLILAFSLAYFTATAFLATRSILHTDELVVLYMAKLPSAAVLWNAIADDTLPPMAYYVTRVALWLFGESHLAIRLPEMLGYWLMSVCIYLFVRAYTPAISAVAAMLTPLTTMAYSYSYFARPYGLMLGFGAAALLCWNNARASRRRFWWLIGLALTLAGALASHWYAVLLFIPLGLGEAVRMRLRKRSDTPMWSAIALGGAVLLPLSEMIRGARKFQPIMSTPLVGLTAILDAYQSILYGTSVLLIGLLIWAWFAYDYSNISREKQDREIYKIPADVLVVVAGLLLTPVSGAGLAVSLTGVYSARYVFLTVVGVAISVGLAIHKFGVRRRHSEVVAVGVVALAGMLHIYQSKIGLFERSAIAERTGLFAILGCSKAMEDSEEPIIVSDIHSFYILRHYGPATLTKRLVYLAEYNALASRMSQAMRRWNNWKVMEYKEFLSNNSRFLIYESEYTSSQAHSPLLGRLIVDGAWVTDSGCTDIRDIYPRPGSLYRVELPINRTSGISASKVR